MSYASAEDWLTERGIDVDFAEKCGVDETFAPDVDVHQSLRPGTHGVVFPYFNADGSPLMDGGLHFKRMRILGEDSKTKYVQGKGTGVHIYLCPDIDWVSVFADPSIPVVITEGEGKAMAMCQNGVACIGLGGVNSIRNAEGEFLPETSDAVWTRRPVMIGFDSDQWKPGIQHALEILRAELSITHRADVRVLRLPGRPAEGYDAKGDPLPELKVGLDDFIVWKGFDALVELMNEAPSASKLDIGVLKINRDCAIIADEERVYIAPDDQFRTFGYFKGASEYATRKLKIMNMNKKGPGKPHEVSIASEWLTHPSARRFASTDVRPGEAEVFEDERGGLVLNRWKGLRSHPGDVSPFLELSDFVFSEVDEEHKDLVMRIVAYKAQNPGIKVTIAPYLIGTKGSGKSLWCNMIVDAFKPHSQYVQGKILGSDFNGYIERSVLIFIDDLTKSQWDKWGQDIDLMVSESVQQVNEKFRAIKPVRNLSLYLLTTNDPKAASFAHDERRYLVIRVPDKIEDDRFYDPFIAYHRAADTTGPHTMDYLLNYDLEGWRPPLTAPATYERAWGEEEGLDPVAALAARMKQSRDPYFIYNAIENAMTHAKALMNNTPPNLPMWVRTRTAEINEIMPTWPVRPFYSIAEIGLMFPDLSEQLIGTKSAKYAHYTPQQISSGLREAGIKPLKNAAAGEFGFMWHGQRELYLVISDVKNPRWLKPLTQEEFELEMHKAESYADVKRRMLRR